MKLIVKRKIFLSLEEEESEENNKDRASKKASKKKKEWAESEGSASHLLEDVRNSLEKEEKK